VTCAYRITGAAEFSHVNSTKIVGPIRTLAFFYLLYDIHAYQTPGTTIMEAITIHHLEMLCLKCRAFLCWLLGSGCARKARVSLGLVHRTAEDGPQILSPGLWKESVIGCSMFSPVVLLRIGHIILLKTTCLWQRLKT
jgi:hypothetical protein